MPFVSEAQRRKLYAMAARGEVSARVVAEFERETRGRLPERARPKRNDATPSAAGRLEHAALAVQADDAVFGSWAIEQRAGAQEGVLYRFDGATWRPAAPARWNASRGRVESPGAAPAVLAALDAAVMADPSRQTAARAYRARVFDTGWRGTSDAPVDRDAELAFAAARRAKCVGDDSRGVDYIRGFLADEGRLPGKPHRHFGANERNRETFQREEDTKAILRLYLEADAQRPVDKTPSTARALAAGNEDALRRIARSTLDAVFVARQAPRGARDPDAPKSRPETFKPALAKTLDDLFEPGGLYVPIARQTPGRVRQYRRIDGEAAVARDVARAALDELCDSEGATIRPGSPCDLALSAIEQQPLQTSRCDAIDELRCPHRISEEQASDWRLGGLPELGPYETMAAHAPGSVPCCFYHPATQERLRLHAAVAERLQRDPTGADLVSETRAAEAAHPLHATWQACDATAETEVGGLPTGHGAATSGTMQLYKAFYDAWRRDSRNEAQAIYRRIAEQTTLHSDFEDFWTMDAPFWDQAHLEAHDTGNLGYITWVHAAMKAAGQTIHHPKGGGARRKRNAPPGHRRGTTFADGAGRVVLVIVEGPKGGPYLVGVRRIATRGYQCGEREKIDAVPDRQFPRYADAVGWSAVIGTVLKTAGWREET